MLLRRMRFPSRRRGFADRPQIDGHLPSLEPLSAEGLEIFGGGQPGRGLRRRINDPPGEGLGFEAVSK